MLAGETLNVVDASGRVIVSNTGAGNLLAGEIRNQSLVVQSNQEVRGAVSSTTSLTLGGDTGGVVTAVTQAQGNVLAATTDSASLALTATQRASGDVIARSDIANSGARLTSGGALSAVAQGNALAAGGADSTIAGSIDQTTTGEIRAHSLGAIQYAPAPLNLAAQAHANVAQAVTTGTSTQNLTIRQQSSGGMVEAASNPSAGNGWNLSARSAAIGNQATAYNEGGRQQVAVAQSNDATIRGAARGFGYDFGESRISADASANQAAVHGAGNELTLDNSQINSGGVSAIATFDGARGYDVYTGANATGNVVIGGCADCGGFSGANVQTNSGAVSAQSTTNISIQGRHVISGTTAVGNSATFTATGGR